MNNWHILCFSISIEDVWVKFDENSYAILKEIGYCYFVFIGEGDENRLHPYKTIQEATEKQLEYAHLPVANNYMMEIGELLAELAKGFILLHVKVLI